MIAAFIVLVLAEFIPRAIFRARSNLLLSRLVWVINIFYQLLQPLASAFINLSNWLLKYVFNVRVDEKKSVFRTDLDALFSHHNEDDEDEESDTELFENALELPKVKIRQCLVPRKEIIGVEAKTSIVKLIS